MVGGLAASACPGEEAALDNAIAAESVAGRPRERARRERAVVLAPRRRPAADDQDLPAREGRRAAGGAGRRDARRALRAAGAGASPRGGAGGAAAAERARAAQGPRGPARRDRRRRRRRRPRRRAVKFPSLTIGGVVLSAHPELATSAPALHPDLGPGAGEARDRALDADALAAGAGPAALQPLPAPGPTESQARAAADVDAAIRRRAAWARPRSPSSLTTPSRTARHDHRPQLHQLPLPRAPGRPRGRARPRRRHRPRRLHSLKAVAPTDARERQLEVAHESGCILIGMAVLRGAFQLGDPLPYVDGSAPRRLEAIAQGVPWDVWGSLPRGDARAPAPAWGFWLVRRPPRLPPARGDGLRGPARRKLCQFGCVAGGERDGEGRETVRAVSRALHWDGQRWVDIQTGRPVMAVL